MIVYPFGLVFLYLFKNILKLLLSNSPECIEEFFLMKKRDNIEGLAKTLAIMLSKYNHMQPFYLLNFILGMGKKVLFFILKQEITIVMF